MRNALLITCLLAACGDPPVRPDAADPVDLDAADPDAPPPPACDPGTGLTLHATAVRPTDAIPSSHVVIAFYQFIDNVEPYPELFVAYDQPLAAFAAGESRCLDIDLAAVSPPASDDYVFCQRPCLDLTSAACDCPGTPPEPTLAFVLVIVDADSSGAIEPDEVIEANGIGVGYLGIAGSAAEHAPPTWLDGLFPEGLGAGLQPYRVIETDSFDQLGRHQPGTIYELNLCPPADSTCDLPFPNLS